MQNVQDFGKNTVRFSKYLKIKFDTTYSGNITRKSHQPGAAEFMTSANASKRESIVAHRLILI